MLFIFKKKSLMLFKFSVKLNIITRLSSLHCFCFTKGQENSLHFRTFSSNIFSVANQAFNSTLEVTYNNRQ